MKYLKNHKKIMLILTENCNLRCKYCYEKEKQRSTMTFEKAKEILTKSLDDMDSYESAVIELHGGEPFLNFDLIKKIDEFVIDRYRFPILFRSTTNGTTIRHEVCQWLYERRDRYEIMLSLDGKKHDHDLNRIGVNGRGSFDMIDLEFFTSTWPLCPVSMTVNEQTLPRLAENTIWIQEQGFECLNAFQWATEWDLEKSYDILLRELRKLVRYYSDHPEVHRSLLVNYYLEKFREPIDDNYLYCVDIDDPIECYDAQGKFAPCHGFTAFTMGDKQKAKEYAEMTIRDFKLTPENICYNCRLIKLCRICFAANYMLGGDMQKQNEEICVFNQLCILAGLQIEKNRLDYETDESKKEETTALINEVAEYLDKKTDGKMTLSIFERQE